MQHEYIALLIYSVYNIFVKIFIFNLFPDFYQFLSIDFYQFLSKMHLYTGYQIYPNEMQSYEIRVSTAILPYHF